MCSELLFAMALAVQAQGISHALEADEREHAACLVAHHCVPLTPDDDRQCYSTRVKAEQPRLMDRR